MLLLRWPAAVLSVVFLACTSEGTTEIPSMGSGDGTDSGEIDDGGTPEGNAPIEAGDAPATVIFGGTIFRQKSDLPILGAQLCLVGQPQTPCELTDSVGRFRFAVPLESDLAVTISAPGFGGIVAAFRTGRADLNSYTIGLPTDHDQRTYYEAAGIAWPSTTQGFLHVYARDLDQMNLAGVTMALAPDLATPPLYENEMGMPDKSLQATSLGGAGRFPSLAAGVVQVGFGPPTILCSTIFGGWPSQTEDAARVPIVAGFETLLIVRCF